MYSTLVHVIAKPHHEIPNVDHDGSFHGNCHDPLSLFVQYLQPPDHVLPQQCEELQIRMTTQAHTILSLLGFSAGGVVIVEAVGPGVRHPTIEVIFGERETQGKHSDEFAREHEAALPIRERVVFKVGQV